MKFGLKDIVEFDIIPFGGAGGGTIICEVDSIISHNPTTYKLYPLNPADAPCNQAFYEIEESRIRFHFPPILGTAGTPTITIRNAGMIHGNSTYINLPVVGTMPLGSFISPAPYKCECGTDSVGGSKHSSYCPKYNLV